MTQDFTSTSLLQLEKERPPILGEFILSSDLDKSRLTEYTCTSTDLLLRKNIKMEISPGLPVASLTKVEAATGATSSLEPPTFFHVDNQKFHIKHWPLVAGTGRTCTLKALWSDKDSNQELDGFDLTALSTYLPHHHVEKIVMTV